MCNPFKNAETMRRLKQTFNKIARILFFSSRERQECLLNSHESFQKLNT